MAILDLTGQQAETGGIQPKINKLNQLMNQRKSFWIKANKKQRMKWINSNKDPIMSLAWTIFKYLYNNFFGDRFLDMEELNGN
jgi:hypothetical protein